MGSGISSVCGSERSVLITNSVRKLPTIPEDDVDSEAETDIDIKPRAGKLHPADSRDSGIGENDIPNSLLHLRDPIAKFGNEVPKGQVEESKHDDLGETPRPSRPHSCRLGHRGASQHSAKKSRRSELTDSDICRLVHSARNPEGHQLDLNSNEKELDSSDNNDTLSTHSSSSPTRDVRPKSAKRKLHKRNLRASRFRVDAIRSPRTVNDLDSSTDTDASDTDLLTIPDETGALMNGHADPPRRRGWVQNEDFTDVSLSAPVTPRASAGAGSGAHPDFYRIVSGTYCDLDANLLKKASERSISSIILTPVDGSCTPTNSECFDTANDLPCHNDQRKLEDLLSSLITALHNQKSRGPCSQSDYENVMKSLRYQLVAMALTYMAPQSTPRIEVQGDRSSLFSNDAWRVQIRLRAEDEEILEASEKLLAKRLVTKGNNISREDLSILLAEHLKTIESLQHVRDSGKLQEILESPNERQFSAPNPKLSPRESESLAQRPGSASQSKRLSQNAGCDVETKTHKLPPIVRSKGNHSRGVHGKHKSKQPGAGVKGQNSITEPRSDPDSLQSSPDSKSRNRRSLNESGIDSECDDAEIQSVENEELQLTEEVFEAVSVLWDNLTGDILQELLLEYRRRQTALLSSFDVVQGRQLRSDSQLSSEIQDLTAIPDNEDGNQEHNSFESDISNLDRRFVESYWKSRRQNNGLTYEEFCHQFADHMKKTKLIRVRSFREDPEDIEVYSGTPRSNSFTGFGVPRQKNFNGPVVRQHSFSGAIGRQSSYSGGPRQNSFLRHIHSRQNSFTRSRSRGSTCTTSTLSSGIVADADDRNSQTTKSSSGFGSGSCVSREHSFGVLNDFEDIEEIEEAADITDSKDTKEHLKRPPSGRRQVSRLSTATSKDNRDKRRTGGTTQVHGLGYTTPTEPLRKIDENANSMPKVEEIEGKMSLRSRPDSGIAVSTSSASYTSSDPVKETDDIDDSCTTCSASEMLEKVAKVRAEQHNDMKSLVAAITKGLNSEHLKAHALYCWLASQDLKQFSKNNRKSSSPPGKLRHLAEKKITHASLYMDMAKVAGLKCEKIEGFVKNKDYLPGNTVQSPKFQHSWVAVSMDGHYRLVDPEYGSCGDKFYMDHFFVTSPDELILSHFPKDKRWHLMNQNATLEDFEGTVKTWPAMFHFNIRPLSMKSVIRTYDGRLSITVLLQNVAVNPQLEYAGPGPAIDSDTLEEKIDHEIRDMDNAETYHVTLPQEGNYYFTVYAHVLEDCIDVPVFQYRIEYQDELL